MEDYPTEITNGVKIDCKDINAAHEEADLILVQQTILASKEGDVVSVISDDTDVFALLLHSYVKQNCSSNMYMSSPKSQKIKALPSIYSTESSVTSYKEHTVVNIKRTAAKHADL